MSIDIGTLYKTQIPALGDTADIQKAFRLYHYGSESVPTEDVNVLSDSVAGMLKARALIASPTFTGTVTSPVIRLTDTTDASLTSTGHAFQIGASSGLNLIIDNNEIMSRNNGSASGIGLNLDGGNVTLGASSSTVSIAGSATVGTLSITGNTTIGDASADTVTANSASWSFPNATTFTIPATASNVAGLTLKTSAGYGISFGGLTSDTSSSIITPWHNGTAQNSSQIYYNYTSTQWIFEPNVRVVGNFALDGTLTGNLTVGSTTSDALLVNSSTTFNGPVTLDAGTNSYAPIKLVSGTNLSTVTAGAVEFDGNVIYATPKVNNTTAGRGLVETPYIYVVSADTTVAASSAYSTGSGTGSTTDSDTASAFGKYIYLAANSTYMVEANVMVFHQTSRTAIEGTVAGGIVFNFAYPSGTTLALDMSTIIDQSTALSNAPAAAPIPYIYNSGAGSIVIRGTGSTTADSGYSMFRIRGIIRTSSTAGNFAPTLTTNATAFNDGAEVNAMTSTGKILANSFIKVTPLGGTTSDVNIGGWA